jgi:hypothetical protein
MKENDDNEKNIKFYQNLKLTLFFLEDPLP